MPENRPVPYDAVRGDSVLPIIQIALSSAFFVSDSELRIASFYFEVIAVSADTFFLFDPLRFAVRAIPKMASGDCQPVPGSATRSRVERCFSTARLTRLIPSRISLAPAIAERTPRSGWRPESRAMAAVWRVERMRCDPA
jgi:hypothetical protein